MKNNTTKFMVELENLAKAEEKKALVFNTQCFTMEEQILLINALTKFNIKASLRR